MRSKRYHFVLCLGLILALVGVNRGHAADQPTEDVSAEEVSTVVMVCEHGTVKSVIAALLFDHEAKQRGLSFRAMSRGITVDDHVPDKIARALEDDGFRVSGFEPQKLSNQDVADATRVIAIGTDLSAFQGDGVPTIQQWDDVPPASVDYGASKASLEAHIHALLDELEEQIASD